MEAKKKKKKEQLPQRRTTRGLWPESRLLSQPAVREVSVEKTLSREAEGKETQRQTSG
jgi:hypothetical protein